MFHDQTDITINSGKGGAGSVSFRHEKFVPRGGPDGGDGGDGGDVYIQATNQLSSLNHLASIRSLSAEDGVPGKGRKLHGANGEDLLIQVPTGTQILVEGETGWTVLYDLTEPGQKIRPITGGKGGLGNVHFATATHQAPKEAEPGEPGQILPIRLIVELIADIGIIGLPNIGKSTLISAISAAKPKIANYAFTTLSPVLGVVSYHDTSAVFADIPGLIEGAASGKGLGHTFLRHIERTKVILHLIDATSDDYAKDYQVIRQEIAKHSADLVKKQEFVALSRFDMLSDDKDEFKEKMTALKKVINPSSQMFSLVGFSATTHLNLDKLVQELFELLSKSNKQG